jgi:hypothetical protein
MSPATHGETFPIPGPSRGAGLGLEAKRRHRRGGDIALRDGLSDVCAEDLPLRVRRPRFELKPAAHADVARIEYLRRVVNLFS